MRIKSEFRAVPVRGRRFWSKRESSRITANGLHLLPPAAASVTKSNNDRCTYEVDCFSVGSHCVD